MRKIIIETGEEREARIAQTRQSQRDRLTCPACGHEHSYFSGSYSYHPIFTWLKRVEVRCEECNTTWRSHWYNPKREKC